MRRFAITLLTLVALALVVGPISSQNAKFQKKIQVNLQAARMAKLRVIRPFPVPVQQETPTTLSDEEILQKAKVREDEVAFLGDDLPDLTVMRRVGLAVAVANAAPEVKRAAHYITARNGGKGAARELVELILKSKGTWEEMIDRARA